MEEPVTGTSPETASAEYGGGDAQAKYAAQLMQMQQGTLQRALAPAAYSAAAAKQLDSVLNKVRKAFDGVPMPTIRQILSILEIETRGY
jgi:hypothetical protein